MSNTFSHYYDYRKRGVTGSILGTGSNAVFVPQHATLIDALTAKETLEFAACLKLPKVTIRQRGEEVSYMNNSNGHFFYVIPVEDTFKVSQY